MILILEHDEKQLILRFAKQNFSSELRFLMGKNEQNC
jgi:hypothetical protein